MHLNVHSRTIYKTKIRKQLKCPSADEWIKKMWYIYTTEYCAVIDKNEILPLTICVDWNAKVGSQEISEVTGKFGLGVKNEAGQRLTEFCQENALVIANTLFQQDGQNWNQTDYILCSRRWRSSIQSPKTRLETDCGSNHELLVAKFRLELKKVGKTTRPFKYDLNQIPYDYTVEMTNRFKGLDLVDIVPEELWTEVHDTV